MKNNTNTHYLYIINQLKYHKMKTPTENQELNSFAELLNKNGWEIIVPGKPSTYLHAHKNGVFIYIQVSYFGGFDFSTEYKPSREYGTGHQVLSRVELNFENMDKAVAFYNNFRGSAGTSIKKYSSIEDYFKTGTNKMLGNHVYNFNK